MAKGGLYPSRKFVGLSGVLKNHHTNIQALFHHYLGATSHSRPLLVEEILLRLQSHLAMEADVLFEVIRSGGPYAMDLVENAMLEHEDIQAMFRQLVWSDFHDGERQQVSCFRDEMHTCCLHHVLKHLLPDDRGPITRCIGVRFDTAALPKVEDDEA